MISDHRDAHIPFVAKYLDKSPIIVDPLQFVSGKELTYAFESGKEIVYYDGVRLQDVKGVWFRKPLPIKAEDLQVAPDFVQYSEAALKRMMSLLFTSLQDATWVSDYYAMVRANNKTLQTAIAHQLGMRVPDTLVTSDAKAANAFIASHPRTVTKPLTPIHPTINGRPKAFFTTLLKDGFMPDLSQLHLAPAIFQQAIEIVADIRVIVVGDQVFAATVKAEGLPENTKVYDYRLGHYEGDVVLKAHDDEFPKDLAELCVQHNKELGLKFGAFDFVLDKDGVYWFLENNPNGQWAFVEEATGQQIGKALADLLQGK